MEAIRIFKSELDAICRQVSQDEYYRKEIGGDLYGLWADDNTPIVFLATGPGPEAHSFDYKFRQDYQEIMKCEEYLFYNYGIQYLGDWHSHHILNLDHPSSGDIKRIHNILELPARHKMIEFIVTHNYDDKQKIEKISGFYYEKGEKPVSISIDELGTAFSVIRADLGAKNSAINLMTDLPDKRRGSEKGRTRINYVLARENRDEVFQTDYEHYNSLFNGIFDRVIKHLKL